MSKCQFTPQAADGILDIWGFIAKDDPEAPSELRQPCCGRVIFLLNRLALDASDRI